MIKKEATRLLSELMNVYPNTRIPRPEATVGTWMMILGEYSAELVYKAARLHMETSSFFPTPADIKKLIPRAASLYNPIVHPMIEQGQENVEEWDIGCDICPYMDNCHKAKCLV